MQRIDFFLLVTMTFYANCVQITEAAYRCVFFKSAKFEILVCFFKHMQFRQSKSTTTTILVIMPTHLTTSSTRTSPTVDIHCFRNRLTSWRSSSWAKFNSQTITRFTESFEVLAQRKPPVWTVWTRRSSWTVLKLCRICSPNYSTRWWQSAIFLPVGKPW